MITITLMVAAAIPAFLLLVFGVLAMIRPDVVYRAVRSWYGLFGYDYERVVASKERVQASLRIAGVVACLVAVLISVAVIVMLHRFGEFQSLLNSAPAVVPGVR